MSVYSLILSVSTVIGIYVAFPLAWHFGSRLLLMCWVVLAILALILYIPQIRNYRLFKRAKQAKQKGKNLLHIKEAWYITLFMGFQSFMAYGSFAWLPSIIAEKGFGASFGADVLFYTQITAVPVSLIAILVLRNLREKYRPFYMATLCEMYVISYAMIFLLDDKMAIIVASLILGMPLGGVFGIALLFISTKSSDVLTASKLSAMAQGFGYIISSLAPLSVGLLHDLNESFTGGILLMILVGLLVNLFALLAYHSKQI